MSLIISLNENLYSKVHKELLTHTKDQYQRIRNIQVKVINVGTLYSVRQKKWVDLKNTSLK